MFTRRHLLAAPLVLAVRPGRAAPPAPFRFCLNTSTVRRADGTDRPLAETIAVAQTAGFAGLEPWVREVQAYTAAGGTLAELAKRLADAGLAVPNLIGFAEWAADDDARRAKGLEQAKRDFDLARQLGCTQLAAPPVGATAAPVAARAAADRYAALLDLGKAVGVTPLVEVWGFSKSLSRLGECWQVAAECGRAGGAVLPDVYHLYKGGSDFAGLRLLSAAAVGIFHVNDYPQLDRGRITDADRVFPGDGVAPLAEVAAGLRAVGYAGFLSLELFNRTYWRQDPLAVARTGLAKLKAAVGD